MQEAISIHSLRVEGDRSFANLFSQPCYFNPLPPRGGRRIPLSAAPISLRFQSTPSAWRETKAPRQIREMGKISIHSLRVEGDVAKPMLFNTEMVFQSTPSAWRETASHTETAAQKIISIHSLRVEGDALRLHIAFQLAISIHSLRVEGDLLTTTAFPEIRYFNPLPPRGGRRAFGENRLHIVSYFNPLPPRGGRQHCARKKFLR